MPKKQDKGDSQMVAELTTDGDKKDIAAEVSELSNDELAERLATLGVKIGPLVGSTRRLYEKKLVKLMDMPELAYSTDEDDAIVEAVAEVKAEEDVKNKKEPEEPVQVRKSGRQQKTKTIPEKTVTNDSYSDDSDKEEPAPVVQNSSSRRRSARIATKSESEKEAKLVERVGNTLTEIAEEETNIEVESEIVENGDDSASLENSLVEDEIIQEEVAEVVPEPAVVRPNNPIPYNTILLVIILGVLIGMGMNQKEEILNMFSTLSELVIAKYGEIHSSLMPIVETIPTDE